MKVNLVTLGRGEGSSAKKPCITSFYKTEPFPVKYEAWIKASQQGAQRGGERGDEALPKDFAAGKRSHH